MQLKDLNEDELNCGNLVQFKSGLVNLAVTGELLSLCSEQTDGKAVQRVKDRLVL